MKHARLTFKPLNGIIVAVMFAFSLILNTACAQSQAPASSLFTYVNSLSKLKARVASAASQQKPVMIEFFATWCPYCKKLDRDVLSSNEVRQSMRRFVTLRVDVSDESPEINRMMDAYNVVGVPTLIFYDKNGNLYDASSLNDGVSRDNLLEILNQLS